MEEQGSSRLLMFEQQSIGKLMLKFSLPAIISMVVNSIYNIVDQIFIGWGVGYLGNAATNVAFPMMTVAMALSTLICDGCVAFFSLKLGEKRYDEAARTMGNGVMIATVTGLIMFLLGEAFLSPLLKLCGATENVFPYAVDYVSITLIGFPLVFIAMTISSLITPVCLSTGMELTTSYCILSLALVTKNAPFLWMILKSLLKSTYPLSIR